MTPASAVMVAVPDYEISEVHRLQETVQSLQQQLELQNDLIRQLTSSMGSVSTVSSTSFSSAAVSAQLPPKNAVKRRNSDSGSNNRRPYYIFAAAFCCSLLAVVLAAVLPFVILHANATPGALSQTPTNATEAPTMPSSPPSLGNSMSVSSKREKRGNMIDAKMDDMRQDATIGESKRSTNFPISTQNPRQPEGPRNSTGTASGENPESNLAPTVSPVSGDAVPGESQESTEAPITAPSSASAGGWSAGAIAGISVATVAVVITILLALWSLWIHRGKLKGKRSMQQKKAPVRPTSSPRGINKQVLSVDEDSTATPWSSSISELREQIQELESQVNDRSKSAKQLLSLVEERSGLSAMYEFTIDRLSAGTWSSTTTRLEEWDPD